MKRFFFSFALFGLVLAQPLSTMAYSTHTAAGLFWNLEHMTSFDADVTVSVDTKTSKYDDPTRVDIDANVIWDANNTDALTMDVSMTDADEDLREDMSLTMIGDDTDIYLQSEAMDDWAVFHNIAVPVMGLGKADMLYNFKTAVMDLMDADAITWQYEASTKIGNAATAVYSYEVDSDSLATYLVENDWISPVELDDVTAQLENSDINGHVWIDKRRIVPVKMTFEATQKTSRYAYESVDVMVLFNEINQPTDVDVPVSATDWSDATMSDIVLHNASMPFTMLATELMDAEIAEEVTDDDYWPEGYTDDELRNMDSDADGLSDYNELTIHWSDPYNPDSDGDGYADGVEIENGYDPNGPGRF